MIDRRLPGRKGTTCIDETVISRGFQVEAEGANLEKTGYRPDSM
jgi:hypothetical protein